MTTSLKTLDTIPVGAQPGAIAMSEGKCGSPTTRMAPPRGYTEASGRNRFPANST